MSKKEVQNQPFFPEFPRVVCNQGLLLLWLSLVRLSRRRCCTFFTLLQSSLMAPIGVLHFSGTKWYYWIFSPAPLAANFPSHWLPTSHPAESFSPLTHSKKTNPVDNRPTPLIKYPLLHAPHSLPFFQRFYAPTTEDVTFVISIPLSPFISHEPSTPSKPSKISVPAAATCIHTHAQIVCSNTLSLTNLTRESSSRPEKQSVHQSHFARAPTHHGFFIQKDPKNRYNTPNHAKPLGVKVSSANGFSFFFWLRRRKKGGKPLEDQQIGRKQNA